MRKSVHVAALPAPPTRTAAMHHRPQTARSLVQSSAALRPSRSRGLATMDYSVLLVMIAAAAAYMTELRPHIELGLAYLRHWLLA